MAKNAASVSSVSKLTNAELGKVLDETVPLIAGLAEKLAAAQDRLAEARAEIARRSVDDGASAVPRRGDGIRAIAARKAAKGAAKRAAKRQRGERGTGFPGPETVKGRILKAVGADDTAISDLLAAVKPEKPKQFGVPLSQLKKQGLLAAGDERGTYKRGPKYPDYAAWLSSQN